MENWREFQQWVNVQGWAMTVLPIMIGICMTVAVLPWPYGVWWGKIWARIKPKPVEGASIPLNGQFVFLYLLTILFEIPGILTRSFFWGLLTTPLLMLAEWKTLSTMERFSFELIKGPWLWWLFWVYLLSTSNILYSLFTILPVNTGGFFTRWALGARRPSRREIALYQDAAAEIYPFIKEGELTHDNWWVIDSQMPNTYTIGTHLYITTTALHDEHLPALLAHEIGHLNQNDGRYLKILRNMVFPLVQHVFTSAGSLNGASAIRNEEGDFVTLSKPEQTLSGKVSEFKTLILFSLVCGGLGVYFLSGLYAAWFRKRDYEADRFVWECQQSQSLISHLEEYQALDTAAPFWNTWSPYSELRIDHLLELDAESIYN